MATNDLEGAFSHLDPPEKPSQIKFIRPAQMILFANVVCHPPLGQTTVIPSYQQAANFTVLIESSKSFPEQGWEAVLWHNCHASQSWNELQLQETKSSTSPLSISSQGRSKVYRRYFSGTIARPTGAFRLIQFTLKYRTSSSDSWKWINAESSVADGEVIFQSDISSDDLNHYLGDIHSGFAVQSVSSEVPGTRLWSLTKSIEGVHENDESTFFKEALGVPLHLIRWFALVRIWSPWLAPRHGKAPFAVTEDAVMCSFLRQDGLHFVLLAVSGVDDVLTVFQHNEAGAIVISSRSDGRSSGQQRIIIAVGSTFQEANSACMYHARKIVNGKESLNTEVEAEMKALPDAEKAQWMENWYDGLTYCTWNALGQDLTQKKIFDALDILDKNKIKITNLIIDDNWQSLDNPGKSQFQRGWTDFEANKGGFPNGLGFTVTTIRDNHPNIQHVAVWHAILGYWGGVSPEGSIAKRYKTKQVRKKEGLVGGTMTVVDPNDVQQMYNDFYQFLLDSRIDSVKTDAQFFLDLLDDAEDRRRFIKAYQDAWTISSLRYFSIKAISCMSQTPQILFHSQLPTNKPRLMVRNSDDFFPEIPASHPWHIFTNAHNSLLTSHLNILPDWDMFQTSHPYSSFHAAGRCVSGGPIYFTDEPGKHDINLLNEMTAETWRGKTVILRPSTIGQSRGVYTAYEEEVLLKVGTFHGPKATGTGILGMFNVSERPISEFVSLKDFPGVETGLEYIVRAHSTGEISGSMKEDDSLALVSLHLEKKGWEILSAFPLRTFTLRGSQGIEERAIKAACLGLLGKMTGAAAITNYDMYVEENGRLRMSVSLKALGLLGLYISNLTERPLEKDFLITILGRVIPPTTVAKSVIVENLLEINIDQAWKEMELDGGWSNETVVEIFIS